MAYPSDRTLSLWTVTSWLARDELDGYNFALWVSPRFLKAASEASYSQTKVQQLAQEIFRGAGRRIESHLLPLTFNKWGLESIKIFGGGRWLSFEGRSDDDLLEKGGQYSCHNIDHASDQSLLFAIWLSWAQFIEMEVSEVSEKK